jgi:hypothetical protein
VIKIVNAMASLLRNPLALLHQKFCAMTVALDCG